MTTPRRAFALIPSTIVLIVALLASSAAAAASFTSGRHAVRAAAHAASHANARDAHGPASEPDGLARVALPGVRAPSLARLHTPQASGSESASHAAPSSARTTLDLVALRAPGAAVDARQDGVTSPGQPAASSRAPPIG